MFQERTMLISLDIYDTPIVSVIAKQYDSNSRFVEAACTEHGVKFALNSEEHKAIIVCGKPDDTVVVNDATILSNGNVLIELTQQMLAVSGRCKCDVMILSADGEIDTNDLDIDLLESYALSTMPFYLDVKPFATSNEVISSSNEFKTFARYINSAIVLERELALKENTRNTNEEARVAAETARDAAESKRIAAESSRDRAETSRKNAENARVTAESNRVAAETSRVNVESARVAAENARVEAENARVNAEKSRVSAEASRVTAESNRATAESGRVTAENNRVTAESARDNAETARKNAESSRVTVENARVSAETSRVNAENSRVTAENNRVTAETARVNAEKARETNVQTVINNCENAIVETEAATERAIQAAEDCEGIADGTSVVLKSDLYDGNNLVKNSKLNTTFTEQEKQVIVSGEELSVILGKIAAYMNAFDNRQQILYNASNPNAEPDNSAGNNGDIYVKVIQE